MSLSRWVAPLGWAVLAAACAKSPAPAPNAPQQPASQPASQPAAAFESGVIKRGAEFTLSEETSLAAVVKDAAAYDGKVVKVRGEVVKACAKKGCWMELKAEGADSGVRVRFKDYAFFVPTDSAGAKALIEGEVKLDKLAPDMAEHLEGEGAKIVRNEAGEAVEIALIAAAVELTR